MRGYALETARVALEAQRVCTGDPLCSTGGPIGSTGGSMDIRWRLNTPMQTTHRSAFRPIPGHHQVCWE